MKDFIEIYKEVQKNYKNKIGVDMTKDLKKQLMKNIEKDSSEEELVQYDRDKFLYYKVKSNAYDINHAAIVLAAVSNMLSVAALLVSSIATIENDCIMLFVILTLVLAAISLFLIFKYKLIKRPEIAKKVNIILDEIDREIWQGKDN